MVRRVRLSPAKHVFRRITGSVEVWLCSPCVISALYNVLVFVELQIDSEMKIMRTFNAKRSLATTSTTCSARLRAVFVLLLLASCGHASSSSSAADDQLEDFQVSSETQEDLQLPTDFQVLDLTREVFRIPGTTPRYFMLGSGIVRPGHPYRLSVNILRSHVPVSVHAAIYRDSIQLSTDNKLCQPGTLQMIEIPIPASTGPGQYALHLEANEVDELQGSFLSSRTPLSFESRSLTMLVQMDSPVYRQTQTVRFRVVLLGTDLESFRSSVDVFLLDPSGIVMKRWMSRQSNWGLVSGEYQLASSPVFGTWQVKVMTRGQVELQSFSVERYLPAQIEVSVESPAVQWTSSDHVPVTVMANETIGGAGVAGNLTLLAEVTPLSRRGDWRARQQVVATVADFSGYDVLRVPLGKLRSLLRALANTEVRFTARLTHPQTQIQAQGHCCTRLFGDSITLKFLGGVSQIFQPHMPYRMYLVAHMSDGSQLGAHRLLEHKLEVTAEVILKSGDRITLSDCCTVRHLQHDGVWNVRVSLTNTEVRDLVGRIRYLRLKAVLKDYFGKTARAQAVARALHTSSHLHLHVVTSTELPKVGEYVIFHLRCNFFMDSFHYIIVSKGILLMHKTVTADVPLHTFAVAVTADMAPESTLLVYHVTRYGQVVSDTLRFPVSALLASNFSVSVSPGAGSAPVSGQLEVSVTGLPDSVVGLAAFQRHLYQTSSGAGFSTYRLQREMRKFDPAASRDEYSYHWSGLRGPTVYLVSHRNGPNLGQTLSNCGLLSVTDADGRTDGSAGPETCPPGADGPDGGARLRCESGGQCYPVRARCDRVLDCRDYSDEANCDDLVSPIDGSSDGYLLRRRSRVLADFSATWLWREVRVGATGHVILQTPPPDGAATWAVSAIGVATGAGYMHAQTQYASVDELELTIDLPGSCRLGELVGVRVTVRSRADTEVTVNVVLARSADYRFVNLPDFQRQLTVRRSDASPGSEHRTSVQLAPRSAHSLTLPVRPLFPGSMTVSVYLEHHGVKRNRTRRIQVMPSGVEVVQHTTRLMDLRTRPYVYSFLDTEVPPAAVPGTHTVSVRLSAGLLVPWTWRPDAVQVGSLTAEDTWCQLTSAVHQLMFLPRSAPASPVPSDSAVALHISTGLQDLMSYRNSDGSFSLYRGGGRHSAVVWSTAHSLRVLCSLLRTWHPLYRPPDTLVLMTAARWLANAQQPSGHYVERAHTADVRFNDTDHVALSAHVAWTLADLGHTLQLCRRRQDQPCSEVEWPAQVDVALNRTLGWLASLALTSRPWRPLQVALVSMALSYRAGSAGSQAAHASLASLVLRQGGDQYWSEYGELPASEFEMRAGVPFVRPHAALPARSSAVLTTALALRAYTALGQLHGTAPAAASWLIGHQLRGNDWGSCSDTLAVMEALTDYSNAVNAGDGTDAQCTVEGSNRDRTTVHITSDTASVPQLVQVASGVDGVKVQCSGDGLVQVQLSTRHWTPVAALLPSAGEPVNQTTAAPPLLLDVQVNSAADVTSTAQLTAKLCVSCDPLRSSGRCSTGSVTMQLQLPAGYILSDSVLQQYVHSGMAPTLAAATLDDSSQLQLVFTSLSESPFCGQFTATRWYPVANTSSHLVASAFETHSPEWRVWRVVPVTRLPADRLCDVCGSYQCAGCYVAVRSGSAPSALYNSAIYTVVLLALRR